MLSRYQRAQLPALSPPRSSSADLAGSKAKMILISGRPFDPGRSSLRWWIFAALSRSTSGPAQRRPFFAEGGHGLRHVGRGVQILLDQGSEPRGVFVGDLHSPGHARLLI
jgi:hypothetical protein